MGRPLKHRFFARGGKVAEDVIGFAGVAVTINGGSSTGTLYSQGAKLTVSAPNNADGITATTTLSINGSGVVTGVTVSNMGSGYNTVPTLTLSTATGQTVTANGAASTTTLTVNYANNLYVGMKAIGTGINASATYIGAINGTVLTLTQPNASTITNGTIAFVDVGTGATFNASLIQADVLPNSIQMTAYLTTGSSAVISEIIKQEGSRSYFAKNAQGRGRVKLATHDALVAGEAKIIATDVGGATYFVKKLTGRKAVLVNRTNTSTALVTVTTDYTTGGTSTIGVGGIAKWTTGSAFTSTTGPVVSITVNAT